MAAITYFSMLLLVPVLMVAFAVAVFVLAGHHVVLEQLMTDTRALSGRFWNSFGGDHAACGGLIMDS